LLACGVIVGEQNHTIHFVETNGRDVAYPPTGME
jgi:hypothetical protein